MANIFVSYNRQTEAITKALVEDVEALGHTVWFDQELSGGQAWWDQILSTIRRCDLFVFVLDPAALNSVACKREYGYAAELRKPILPILVSEGVSTNLLPPSLSKIEFVDYRQQDRTAALRLARAVNAVPPAAALPDPLPNPPEAPISYLGSLAAKVQATSPLTYEEQSVLVFDLRRGLRDPETTDDTRTLLKMFRKRRDLFAGIAEEIDELFQGSRETSSRRAAATRLEDIAEPVYQEPQQTNVAASSDASTAPQAQIKSRVSTRRSEPGTLLSLIFDRDLLIFVAKWTLACLLGEALGNVVAVATYEIASSTTIASELRWGIAIGVAVGSMQWVLLRRRIDYSQWWIVLTTIGWVIAFITPRFIRLPELLAEAVYQGVPVGTMQWLLLRRSVSRAAWWILIVSMAALITIGAEFDALGRPHWKIWDSAPWGPMAGALKGVITGFGLGILLQRSGRGLRA